MGPLVKRLILETDVNSLKLTEVLLMILNYLAYISFGFNDTIERNSWLCLTPEVWKDTSHFSKNFSKKKTVHIRKTKIFFWCTQSKLPQFCMVEWCPFPLHPQSAWISLKEAARNQVFGGGQLKPSWNSLGFFCTFPRVSCIFSWHRAAGSAGERS